MSMNGYRCFACSAEQTVAYDGFLCPVCGGNLDVTYDYDAVSKSLDHGFHDGSSDLFRFSKLLPLEPAQFSFPLRVGGTPLYAARRLGEVAGMRNL